LIPYFISRIPEVKVSIPRNSEEYIVYLDSTPVGSPVYISCKSEEPIPCFPFSPFSDFPSPTDMSLELHSPHSKVVEGPLQVYENPLFNSQSSSPHIQMATIGGGGVVGGVVGGIEGGARGGARGGGGQGPPPPPPRIFSKLVSIYAPLALSPVLHDLHEKLHVEFTKVHRRGRFNGNRAHKNFQPIC
jgi:hypothetical protein